MKAVLGHGVLLAFIGAGVLFRIAGLDWGIPRPLPPDATVCRNSFNFDEDNYLWGLTRMKPRDWDLDVGDLHWGTLQFYLIAGALQAGQAFGYLTRPWKPSFLDWDPENFTKVYVCGRAASACAGTLSLVLIFLAGWKLKDVEAGLGAAALLAVSPLHVVNSHFLTSDVTMVLLLVAAFFFFLSSLERPSTGFYVAGGFLLGLAISAKYNAAFMILLWVARDVLMRGIPWKPKILGYASLLAGFAVGEPYAFAHPREFLFTLYQAHFATTASQTVFLPHWPRLMLEQARNLAVFGLQWPVAAASVLGLLLCIARPSGKRVALAGAILFMSASLVFARWPMIRYTLPLVPLAILSAALLVVELPVKAGWRPWNFALLGSLSLVFSWAQVKVLVSEHPANAASEWIQTHIPPGSRIGQIWPDLPPLDARRYDVRALRGIFPGDPAETPDLNRQYLVLDNLPIHPFAGEFSERLERDYVLLTEFRLDARIGAWIFRERDAPHDWKYTHPVLRIYRHR
jgi:hypothetical protein